MFTGEPWAMKEREQEPVNILLVDDRSENLVSLKSILARPDYRLFTATSGREALELALREAFSVILLDVIMPEMDGFEVARILKQLTRTQNIPILFLTAIASNLAELYQAYEIGAVDYLVKPLNSEVVKKKVGVFVDLVRQREELVRQSERLQEARRKEDEIQIREQAREDLLAIVSHDLRNPLSSILNSANVLERLTGDERALKYARSISRSAERMERLISDLLDLAQVRAGRLTIERRIVEAASLIQESVELLKPVAEAKNLRLAHAADWLNVSCDPHRVLQVLSNILGNAIKFTPEGGSVFVKVTRAGAHARFEVTDSGPGIPEAELAHVWERFWTTRKQTDGGIGLGLSIAKGLVEAHGGRIWVESALGTGTTFYWTLPLAPSQTPESEASLESQE